MKKIVTGVCVAVILQGQMALAQDVSVDDQGLPVAPEVVPPDWPPPENLCALDPEFDFAKERRNPGLQTSDQYRKWSITDYDRNNPDHNYFLGLMHEYGRGVLKDQRRADALYKQAAQGGVSDAMVRLGESYCRRELYCLAAQSFHDAAMRDNARGQVMLAKLYRWGLGVYYDPVNAYKWQHLAMEKTNGNWLIHDYEGVLALRELERIITDEEAERAETMIDDWKRGFNQQPVDCREE